MICPEALRPDEEAHARRAVVGAERVVLLGTAPELAPDERHHAVGEARLLQVLLERLDRQAVRLEVVAEARDLVGMGVEAAVALERAGADRQARLEQLRETLEVAREPVVRRVDDRARRQRRVELPAQQRGVAVGLARLGDGRVAGGRVTEVVEAAGGHRAGDAGVPDAGAREVVAARRVDGGDRDRRAREHRRELPAEAEPLDRVVHVADDVEPAAEPSGRAGRVQRADLVEVPRGEVRLVRVVVGDRREDRDLLRVVQGLQRGGLLVPAQRVVAGERVGGAHVELRAVAHRLVAGVGHRGEHAHPVDPAGEEDRHDHGLGRAGRRLGDARSRRRRARACRRRTR